MRVLIGMVAVLALAGCAGTDVGGRTGTPAVSSASPPRAGTTMGIYKVGSPYQVNGVWYYPAEDYSYDETGIASWYGPGFHNKVTANGEIYDQNQLTAAHKTLPMPSLVRVTNLENGRSIIVRINDRGPFVPGRIIDLSRRGAQLLGFERKGIAKVRVTILPEESRALAAAARARQPAPEWAMAQVAASEAAPAAAPRIAVEVEGAPPPPAPAPRPVRETVAAVAGSTEDGRFLPAPVVSVEPVSAAGNIYVQAGAFTIFDNANRLRARLSTIGPALISPVMVEGTQFFRVRIGPIATVEEADVILARVIEAGSNGARVIVD